MHILIKHIPLILYSQIWEDVSKWKRVHVSPFIQTWVHIVQNLCEAQNKGSFYYLKNKHFILTLRIFVHEEIG